MEEVEQSLNGGKKVGNLLSSFLIYFIQHVRLF